MMILFSKTIGPIPVSVIVKENHRSSLGITENPIETGAKITDHAYVEPKRLELEFADANAAATYNALVRFQEARVPFTVVSGLYVYTNMLIKGLSADRDHKTANVLSGKVELQEAIIVSTAYTTSEGETSSSAQSKGKPGGKKSTQAARPTSERAGDAATADRASGTVTRGDTPAKTVAPSEHRSIVSRWLS